MNAILGALLLAFLVIIGVEYWSLFQENKRLREDEDRVAPYVPTRQIFIYKENGSHMQELIKMCLSAHCKAGVSVTDIIRKDRSVVTYFSNGDVVMTYEYGAQMTALTHAEVTDCTIRVFMDNDLPDSAIRACIENLGLRNYLIGCGLCDSSQGGKDNG